VVTVTIYTTYIKIKKLRTLPTDPTYVFHMIKQTANGSGNSIVACRAVAMQRQRDGRI
jgi:hypothetical protein